MFRQRAAVVILVEALVQLLTGNYEAGWRGRECRRVRAKAPLLSASKKAHLVRDIGHIVGAQLQLSLMINE
jgi:hypothetical protein